MHPLITNFIRGLEMPARPPEDAFLQQGELSLPSSVSPPPAANATSAAAIPTSPSSLGTSRMSRLPSPSPSRSVEGASSACLHHLPECLLHLLHLPECYTRVSTPECYTRASTPECLHHLLHLSLPLRSPLPPASSCLPVACLHYTVGRDCYVGSGSLDT